MKDRYPCTKCYNHRHFFDLKYLARGILFVFSAAAWLIGGLMVVSTAEMPASAASVQAQQIVMCAISATDEALPAQVEDVRTPAIQRTAKQQQRWQIGTIYAITALRLHACQIIRKIILTGSIVVALPAYEICFPFSAFW